MAALASRAICDRVLLEMLDPGDIVAMAYAGELSGEETEVLGAAMVGGGCAAALGNRSACDRVLLETLAPGNTAAVASAGELGEDPGRALALAFGGAGRALALAGGQ